MKSFIQLPKHKVFDYKPLYYNPDKDYIKRRREELGLTNEVEKLAGTGGMLRAGSMRMRHGLQAPHGRQQPPEVRAPLAYRIDTLRNTLRILGRPA